MSSVTSVSCVFLVRSGVECGVGENYKEGEGVLCGVTEMPFPCWK